MSTTVNTLGGAKCGCATPETVQPDNLVVVPNDAMIVAVPGAANCSPPSSAALAQVQQEGQKGNCDIYKNPCVTSKFQMVGTNKTGTMSATCASAWAMPGLQLFFPGLGYVEVKGVSGDVITYKNLTIEGGTEILAGICFHHDAPGYVLVDEDGEEVDEWEEGTGLEAIYGTSGNVQKKIVPVNGMMLYACGGKWYRRQVGQMRYPITKSSLVAYNSTCKDKIWTVDLPNKPTIPECSLALSVELHLRLSSHSTHSSTYPTIRLLVNGGDTLIHAHAHPSYQFAASTVIIDIPKDATSINIETDSNTNTGKMIVDADLLAYHY